jgi:SAM-dependent methyltransferase
MPHQSKLLAGRVEHSTAAGRPLASARNLVRRSLGREALPEGQWCRKVLNNEVAAFLDRLGRQTSSTVEISGTMHRDSPWRSYETLSFPGFDLCSSTPARTFDVVICEQVLEHVVDPWRAAETLRLLCRPGGHLVVTTPFLIKVHREPQDYWRFTPEGLRILLERAGLECLEVKSWGNRSCVRRNFLHWAPYQRWRSLRNESDFPIVVWAFARRSS